MVYYPDLRVRDWLVGEVEAAEQSPETWLTAWRDGRIPTDARTLSLAYWAMLLETR